MSKQTRAYRAAPGAQQQRDQRYADAFRGFECDLHDAANIARICVTLVEDADKKDQRTRVRRRSFRKVERTRVLRTYLRTVD